MRIPASIRVLCTDAMGVAVSPTVFRSGPYRFYFFSREETRMHVHVRGPDGEAKFWLEPHVELARRFGISDQTATMLLSVVRKHEHEICEAWKNHFGG